MPSEKATNGSQEDTDLEACLIVLIAIVVTRLKTTAKRQG